MKGRKPVTSTERIQLAKNTRVIVVADTHSKPHPNTIEIIKEKQPDLILHAGDIGTLSVLDPLKKIAPLIAVRGNIDSVKCDLPDVVTIFFESAGVVRSCWLLTHIAVRGPKLKSPIHSLASAMQAQLVVCGHSHVPLLTHDRGIAVFNPGSCGPRRFVLPILIGQIDIDQAGLHFQHIACSTGETWRPDVG
ncbi:MAG: YfcE family phosphodiesterase [Myxococcales bacterium]|nr:YfcE family phosphodiesterase [Myxococcales bacterium]|tara:strand:- start:864 stop:1439 length:576 start_codon:yes stop_codon:yes gene_type:complete